MMHRSYAVCGVALAVVCLGLGAALAQESGGDAGSTDPAVDQFKPRRIGPNRYMLGQLLIDTRERTIRCPALVNIREGGPIELLACLETGRVHESVLVLRARPLHVQIALLLLGLSPGRNPAVHYAEGAPELELEPGALLELALEWEAPAEGNRPARKVECQAHELLRNVETGRPTEPMQWAFIGSRWLDGQFGAEVDGSVVVTYHDPFAVLELAHEEVNDDIYFHADGKVLPAPGTRAELIIQAPPLDEAQPGSPDADVGHVALYAGYGTPEKVLVWGRALEDAAPAEPEGGKGSRLGNLWRSVKLLETDELKRKPVTVTCAGRQAKSTTDGDGFFRVWLRAGKKPFPLGDVPVTVRVHVSEGNTLRADGSARVRPKGGGTIIVSDFDDTLCLTGVDHKVRAGLRTLVGSSGRMKPVRGMAGFLRLLADTRATGGHAAPVFYVSGTPVNLYPRITAFLRRNGFPDGVLILRNFGLRSHDDSIKLRKYKLERIEALMELYDGSAFVLIGDSGGSDPEVYAELKTRHPQRVRAILVRLVDPDDAKGERLRGMRTFHDGADAAMEAHGAGLFRTDPGREADDNGSQEKENVAK